jgi:drug/metabolite transporter (DMT)-like permease
MKMACQYLEFCGDALIILSGLFYAIDVNICKYVSDKIDAKRVTQITSFASGIFALLVLVILKIPFDVNLNDIPMMSILGIAGTGIATLFFVMALRLLGGVKAILLYSTTAIFGIIFSGVILYEKITFVDIFSITLVILGIYLMRNKLGKE